MQGNTAESRWTPGDIGEGGSTAEKSLQPTCLQNTNNVLKNGNLKMETTDNETEFKLKENQERFFSAQRDHIQKCLEHEDSESLAKMATFLLKQFEDYLKANESLKEKIKYIKEQHEAEIQKLYGELSYFKQKTYSFTGALISIYRMVDKHAGEEIRETLAKNDETYRQSQIKLLTEQLNRFTKQEQDDGTGI